MVQLAPAFQAGGGERGSYSHFLLTQGKLVDEVPGFDGTCCCVLGFCGWGRRTGFFVLGGFFVPPLRRGPGVVSVPVTWALLPQTHI